MDSLKDLILRYCVLFGRRFSYKEKIAFLRVISKELLQLGYHLDAKIAKLQLAKKKYENYYNAYIGDINKADVIVCTYYDTGANYFNLSKIYAFEQEFKTGRYFLSLLPIFILVALSVVLNYFVFIPGIQELGFFSVQGVSSVLSTVVLFYFILKYKNGIPNKKNFVSNTSSILVMLDTINKLDKKTKKKVAFVLYDGGTSSRYGIKMLENYSDKVRKKKVIFLDSLGNGEQLQFFKPKHFNCELENVTFHEGKMETTFKNYMMVTAGSLDADNKVQIKNAHSGKDSILSVETVEQHSEALYHVITSMVTKSKEERKEGDSAIEEELPADDLSAE
ncbi:hypothetical protein [Zophobihabitans entericus]|uniref:Uncharacterized protein n=1 Tax=Zophobihabitans entericus TaxID=1635327 RepID=A0A6G9IF27_9GAMM|nr:hypothetical protein [Zophobihabitans entericus]QIQ22200.1 hypothetical protein IPMB12_11175 [Zophobihabitans entericus]